MTTPQALGFRMPAEWEPHAATWMTWPARHDTSFPGEGMHDAVIPTFLEMIKAILASEPLYLNCASAEDRKIVLDSLTPAQRKRLTLTAIPAVYPWCRDHGSTFVVNDTTGEVAAVNWDYNAWGGKYPEILAADSRINRRMATLLGMRAFQPGVVMEGGSIEVNGCGDLLTTTQCLLNPNRNPEHSKKRLEAILAENLGVSKVHWLDEGIVGDDTDGHIDDITRFVSEDTILTVVEPNKSDANHHPLAHNRRLLGKIKLADGSKPNIVELPMPAPVITRGERLPASYANFYIGNTIILLPVFGDKNDEKAVTLLQSCFPSREVVPIDCRKLVWGLGTFHCLTQQQPSGKPKSKSKSKAKRSC